MTTMSLATTHLTVPEGGWTADDLAAFPDDGLRYELVDGVLLVSAAPSEQHQIAVLETAVLLRSVAPPHLRVLTAPYDVRLGVDRQLQPDVVVLPKDRTVADRTPLLVVEVLSPSTRATDSTLKRLVFEQGGVPAYWLLDPLEPSLTVLRLVDGVYREQARVRDQQSYATDWPFPVRVVPRELLV